MNTDSLSVEQKFAFEKFKKGENLFISGPGGSGKSYFIKFIVQYLHEIGKIHQVTSTTGCSSILLSNNIHINNKPIIVRTIHSWSGIRLCKGTKSEILKNIQKRLHIVKEWKINQVLIIDEISMLSKKFFDTLDYVSRVIRNRPDIPFGGMQIICLGDFYQLSPVGDRDDPETQLFCFESPIWNNTFPTENHIEFTNIFRQNDEIFKTILNEVRCGKLSPESSQILMSRVDAVYDADAHDGILPMKIFATKNQVASVNQKHFNELDSEPIEFTIDVNTNVSKYIESGLPFEEEVMEKIMDMSPMDIDYECKNLIQNIPVDESIKLKKGAIVMCLINLDINLGIANGSMGKIIDFVYSSNSKSYVPMIRFFHGAIQQIEKHTWQSSEYPNICVSQIPLCLAYANSIHKMQGSTLDVCEMNLGSSIFAEHQIYVALSRVRSLDGVYLNAFHPNKIRVNPKVIEFYSKFLTNRNFEINNTILDNGNNYIAKPNIGECPICLDRCNDSQITECKHVFCKTCILRHIQCSIRGNAICPMCRNNISIDSLKPVNKSKNNFYKSKTGYRNNSNIFTFQVKKEF